MPEPTIRKWAKPRGDGPVRVLFISGGKAGMYECLSLADAFDLECDVIPYWKRWNKKVRDENLWNLLRYYLKSKRYNVIAVSDVWVSRVPGDCRREIADQIRNDGVGLVHAMHGIHPRKPAPGMTRSPILGPLLPLEMDTTAYKMVTEKAVPAGHHILAGGQDFARLRWMCNVDTSLRSGATAILNSEDGRRVLAAVVTRGKGRVIAWNLGYGEESGKRPAFLPLTTEVQHRHVPGNLMDRTKADGMGKFSRWMNGVAFANQFYGWMGKAIVWAAKREPTSSLGHIEIGVGQFTVTVRSPSNGERNCRIRAVVRSLLNSRQESWERRHTLAPGNASAAFPLPATGMLGEHFLDVYLLDNEGAVLDWRSTSFEVSGSLSVAYEPDYTAYSSTSTIALSFEVSVPPDAETLTATTELFDLHGRLLARQRQAIAADGATALAIPISVNLAATGIRTRLANGRFTFEVSGETVELRDQFFVTQEPDWGRYHVMAYDGFRNANPMWDVFTTVLKRTGHDTIRTSYPSPVRSRLAAETGMRQWGSWMSARGSTPEKMSALVGWFKDFSPVKYELKDEPELRHSPGPEKRFDSADHMAHFRVWLRKKYATLDALNAAWDTGYESWTDIQRFLWHEVVDSDNWTAWFDSRRNLDDGFLEVFVTAAAAVNAVAPGSACSVNPRAIETFSGINLGDFARGLGSANLYNDYVRGRSPMGYLQFAGRWFSPVETYIGYTWSTSPGIRRITREAWDSARRGANIGWYMPIGPYLSPDSDFSYFNGDFTLNRKGAAIEAVNRVLLSGPGDLAVNTEPLREGIFVYYPRTLFYCNDLAFFEQSLLNNPDQDREALRGGIPLNENRLPHAFLPHLDSLGYQYEFGDAKDLTAERLRKTRVVLLQNVVCLGREKLELLLQFVNHGGCVVAEAGTARRDENGRAYAKTPEEFKTIFGIERITPNLSPLISEDAIRMVTDEVNDRDYTSGTHGRVFRKGNAFFLNFHMPTSNAGIHLLDRLLTAAGVEPTYRLHRNWLEINTTRNLICSMVVRQKGALSYLYLLGDGNKIDDGFSINLPGTPYVYDVLGDRDLGPLGRLDGQIQYGEARLFALSPSPCRALTLTSDRSNLAPGERTALELKLTTEDGKPGDRLVMLEHESRASAHLPDIPRAVLLKDGNATLRFFVPLNILADRLSLTARDLTSGVKAHISFR